MRTTLKSGQISRFGACVPLYTEGMDKQPERQILKLSDAYEKRTEDPELELKVLMLNINPGHNSELKEKCRTLWEYCEFVSCIRRHTETENTYEAVENAVTECIEKGILADFLLSQLGEIPEKIKMKISQESDMERLYQWLKVAAAAKSVEEFAKAAGIWTEN